MSGLQQAAHDAAIFLNHWTPAPEHPELRELKNVMRRHARALNKALKEEGDGQLE